MKTFKSWQSYNEFAQSVKYKSRYDFEGDVNAFLGAVISTCQKRRRKFPKGSIFWRAQLGHEWETRKQGTDEFEVPCQYSQARMKPPLRSAKEGRVNPPGIPCLYLCTDKETAMAEVRPCLGSHISVGQFKTLKDLSLADCSRYHRRGQTIYFQEPRPTEREKCVWADIDRAFSEPVNPDESTLAYAPTQVLAETFRSHGYDGIVYKSLLGEGFNIALFEIESADLINCSLYKAKAISFKFREAGNPYFVSKHYACNKEENA